MQTSYGFSGLLCSSKTNTNSHSHSAPALYLTTRAEARVGGNSCRQSFRATRTSSWMLTGIVKCFKSSSYANANMPKHATAMFMLSRSPCWLCQLVHLCLFLSPFPFPLSPLRVFPLSPFPLSLLSPFPAPNALRCPWWCSFWKVRTRSCSS